MAPAQGQQKQQLLQQHNSNEPPPSKDQAYLEVVLPKRVTTFIRIQKEQELRYEQIGGAPLKVTLRDGAVKEGKKWITKPVDIAMEINPKGYQNWVIAKVATTGSLLFVCLVVAIFFAVPGKASKVDG